MPLGLARQFYWPGAEDMRIRSRRTSTLYAFCANKTRWRRHWKWRCCLQRAKFEMCHAIWVANLILNLHLIRTMWSSVVGLDANYASVFHRSGRLLHRCIVRNLLTRLQSCAGDLCFHWGTCPKFSNRCGSADHIHFKRGFQESNLSPFPKQSRFWLGPGFESSRQ